MGTLIKFELRKILGNRAGMVACVCAFALLVALSVMNLAAAALRDFDTGEVAHGFAAQQVVKQRALSHAGVLDDARVATDAEALDHANELATQVDGFDNMDSQQVIDEYGLEFWRQTDGVRHDQYYYEVVGTLDCTDPRATSLQAGAEARLAGALANDQAAFGDVEEDYWMEKAAGIGWPLEYGYAGGWKNALDFLSFSALGIVALCMALSGVFAGEYQSGAAAIALPTRRGKRALPAAKVAAALLFALAYWCACAFVPLSVNLAACGADGWDLPLQVIDGFDNPYPFTVGQTVLLAYGLSLLVTFGMAALTLALSAKMRLSMPVAVIPMVITFLGLMGLFVGWQPLVKVSLLTPLSGLNYAFMRMVSYAVGSFVTDLPTVLAILYAAMLVVLVPLAMRTFKRHQVA